MNRIASLSSLATLLLLGLALGGLANAQQLEAQSGGNEALMREWAAKKQRLKDKVYQQLKEAGQVPENGVVYFEARTRQDPNDPAVVLFELDKVEVQPQADRVAAPPAGASSQTGGAAVLPSAPTASSAAAREEALGSAAGDVIFAPAPGGDRVEYRELDIPVGAAIRGRLEIRDGKPVEAASPSAPKQDEPWYKQLF